MISIPFNFQPESVSVKTGSYTIPAGKYAYVTAVCKDGGTFSIDAQVALRSDVENETITAVTTQDLNTNPYTVPSGYLFEGQVGNNTNSLIGAVSIGATDIAGGGTPIPVKVSLASGQTITSTSVGDDLTGYIYKPASESNTTTSASFWVPSGTDLTESGTTSYTVSLFNNIA